MASYACTSCLNWFNFDDLSKDSLLCSTCVHLAPAKKKKKSDSEVKSNGLKRKRPKGQAYKSTCKFCKTSIRVYDKKENKCERCIKNLKEYGKPKKCSICDLEAAFIGSKCQRCSGALKKFGPPVICFKCGLKSAFNYAKAQFNGKLYCWVCCMEHHRELRKSESTTAAAAGGNTNDVANEEVVFEETVIYDVELADDVVSYDCANVAPVKTETKSEPSLEDRIKNMQQRMVGRSGGTYHKHLAKKKHFHDNTNDDYAGAAAIGEPPYKRRTPDMKTGSGNNNTTPDTPMSLSRTRTTPISNDKTTSILPAINDGNIVVVTKLREEIAAMKKQLAMKDKELLEKDKQTSILKVEHLRQVKALNTKINIQEETLLKTIEGLRQKNQELIKKIAQLSKR